VAGRMREREREREGERISTKIILVILKECRIIGKLKGC
jgi:hypothetical protein